MRKNKHGQLMFQKDLINAKQLNFDDQKGKLIEQPTTVHAIMTSRKCEKSFKRRKSTTQNLVDEVGHKAR